MRRLFLALALICAAGSARAACTLPYALLPPAPADATKIMANLEALVNCANHAISPYLATPSLEMPIYLTRNGPAQYANITNPAQNALQLQGQGNNLTTAWHINPGPGTLPKGTIDEFVLHRTNLQAFGGIYGRWSFTAQGSDQGNVTGLFGEFGGTAPIGPFVLQVGIENPPATFASYEGWRFQTSTTGSEDDNIGAVLFGLGATVPRNQIVLPIANISVKGTRDSHAVLWEGKANDGTERAVWWRAKVNVTANAGASSFLLQQNLNGGGWVTWLEISDAGVVSGPAVATGKLYVTQSSPASGDACAPGQIVADTGFIYACTASGAWKRAALTGGY